MHLSFHLGYLVFCLLSSWAHNFEGFDIKNPREHLRGEIFHSPCSKLGLGDEIIHPHHSTLITGSIIDPGGQQGRTIQGYPTGVHHCLRESSIQHCERALRHSSTWVLLAGPCSSVWRYFGGVTSARLAATDLGRLWEKEDVLVIQIISDPGGYTSDLIVRLLQVTCGSPIYHPREFHGFWRLPSSRPKYWHFRVSGGHSLD